MFDERHPDIGEVDADVAAPYLADEVETVRQLVARAGIPPALRARIQARAAALVAGIKARQRRAGGVDALLGEYDLSSAEGVVLMCLAEALLRIPDAATADRLIADKLGGADWQAHLGASDSLFVNASTWALLLTGRIVRAADVAEPPSSFFARLIERLGEPVVRSALRQAMKILGQQFVMGETIDAALARAARAPQFDYSFDMLGEAALTAADAARYFGEYRAAIARRGPRSHRRATAAPSVSVKLSALSPRYERAQAARALDELGARLFELAAAARGAAVELTVDAEEADRLELSLAIFARVFADPRLGGYAGLGIAVQAYQKRALPVLRWLERLARAGREGSRSRCPCVSSKAPTGIRRSSARKSRVSTATRCSRARATRTCRISRARKRCWSSTANLKPQFATHNAHTVAWILEVGAGRAFEFQRLHGMGEELYAELLGQPGFERRCRVYAPVGSHEHLLPYLVRRLLENGANTSFVNRLVHADAAAESIVADPLEQTLAARPVTHPRIPPPRSLFAPERVNSRGWNVADGRVLRSARRRARDDQAGRVARRAADRRPEPALHAARVPRSCGPHARRRRGALCRSAGGTRGPRGGERVSTSVERHAPRAARRGPARPRRTCSKPIPPSSSRAARAETGRTVVDALAEVREAVDLLRYYAAQAERHFAPTPCPDRPGSATSSGS